MKRLKKILQWTGIALGVLAAIVLVVNACLLWTTGTRLEGQLAAIRQAGDPLSLPELAREPIPPQSNAATFLRRIDTHAIRAIEKEALLKRNVLKDPLCLISPEDQKAVRAVLDAHPEVISLIEQAAACPDYDAGLDYALPPQEFQEQLLKVVQDFAGVRRVLYIRAVLLASEGRRDQAVRTALMIFRLAHHCDRNPTILGHLVATTICLPAVGCANLALQTGPVSKEVRDALDAELARQDRMDGYVWTIKSERAFTTAHYRTFPGAISGFCAARTGIIRSPDRWTWSKRFLRCAQSPHVPGG